MESVLREIVPIAVGIAAGVAGLGAAVDGAAVADQVEEDVAAMAVVMADPGIRKSATDLTIIQCVKKATTSSRPFYLTDKKFYSPKP